MLRSRSHIGSGETQVSQRRLGLLQIPIICACIYVVCCMSGCGGSTGSSTSGGSGNSAEPNNCKSTSVTSPAPPAPSTNYSLPNITGTVLAGSSPVAGSAVQLYAAGTTGNGSAPTALLSSPAMSDTNGAFAIPANLSCPYSNSVVYMVARGGSVGASSNANSAIALLEILGTCSGLKSGQPVVVDEATTIAGTWAMSQFITPGGQIGATSTNSSGITLAAAMAVNLVDRVTGKAPGANFASNGVPPVGKINALADALNACAESSGSTSSPCTQLFAAAAVNSTTPTNTLDAAVNIAHSPAATAASIFALSNASTVYVPSLSSAPVDWTLSANYTGGGMNGPTSVSIDSQGRVWVANYFNVASLFSNTGVPVVPSGINANGLLNSYGGAVDVNDTMWVANEQSAAGTNNGLGSLTLINSSGVAAAQYTSGGLNFPIAVAFDTSGVAWIVNYGNSHITLLSATGSPLSGSTGYTAANLEFPSAIATDSKCNAYVANQSSNTITRVLADGSGFTDFVVGGQGPASVAIDSSDNVWSANFYGNNVGLVSSAGNLVSGAGYTGGGLNAPRAIAVDGSGNAWVASEHGISLAEFASASSATPGALLSPSSGWGSDARLSEPYSVAIDAAGDIWVSNYASDTLTEFIGLAAPVKTPLLGPVRVP